MHFASDNWSGAAPEILDALHAAAAGPAPAYGADPLTARAAARLRDIFETDCAVHFLATGSAANGLSLASLCPPFGTVLCHEASHIQTDECGCPEFYTGGAKLTPLPGEAGKLTPDAIRAYLAQSPNRPPHSAPLSVLALTQATECGTLYSVEETAALCALARELGMKVQMDGARFANAVAATGASPAALTWKAGVDALAFGGSKNGCIAAEAVVFFDPALAHEFAYRRKRGGHLWSKMRFLSAQFDAYLTDGLWLRLAAHANAMAKRLSAGLAAIEGVAIAYETQINAVFAVLPDGMAQRLWNAGAHFYPWVCPGDPAGGRMARLVCSFETTAEEIDRFLALAAEAARSG